METPRSASAKELRLADCPSDLLFISDAAEDIGQRGMSANVSGSGRRGGARYTSVCVIELYDRVGGRTTRYPHQRNGWND